MSHILIVEDDAANRYFVECVLHQNGHTTTSAGRGREALETLRRTPPDLIVLDIKLPDMGGVEIARFIRSSEVPLADTPILAVTAFAMQDDITQFLAQGIDQCLIKPFASEALIAAVDELLGT